MGDINYSHFTLGVEEEYMVLDPHTRELKSHEQKIVLEGQKIIKDKVKAEMHQAVVEVGTDICRNIDEAFKDVATLRGTIAQIAGDLGLWVGASGTHPFSHWEHQLITDHARYNEIVNELQEAARSNLIFGLHVHVGMEDRRMAMHIANTARYFLPHVYALSTNSPFWEGRLTGYKSFRTKVFDKFPRTGIPDFFESIEAYENYVNLLIKTNCIDNAKKIWWDLRVHPFFNTVEFRICDVPLTVNETIAIAALFQAICAKIYKLRSQNLNFMMYQRSVINENKWRASRYGIDGALIDFGKETEVNTRALIYELMDFVDDVVDDLGSRHSINYIHTIFEQGTGADRQLAVYQETNSLASVVDYIHDQFLLA
ncbi:carboxylate-amine ligase [Hydrobacter penzbergensis]|jgi:carboxylate-amine ligase|uniref:Putative glutamate--cysteine ligase 2 n=1 Tax=Hydrobacter penzbergensis TaxID=1235997 RepID=A0A8X8LCQ0_9BACT|nr:carboxylate-amine ligase [Hydrobacter penzbergensis]MBN8718345.1 carboxylate-amine ligase [Sediminibacterium magnilacihabitans]PQV62189.1 carboxylate-amine ligase [Sediminibacterium magnilacihabitans]SDW12810.1 carboxylate-amine ligase [Hydrobacter penzbergensis]